MFNIVFGSPSEFDDKIQTIFWPMALRLAKVHKHECMLWSLFGNDQDHSAEEARAVASRMLLNIEGPILSVGPVATSALLGDKWVSMPVHSGMAYMVSEMHIVSPCWSISAALAGGNDGKDPLAWIGDALSHWFTPRFTTRINIPEWEEYTPGIFNGYIMAGVDTEGTPQDPLCMTVANPATRVFVDAADVAKAWKELEGKRLIYHNAPWDWAVLEAMGVCEPWKRPFSDTMERAYLRQTEPQGLKDLGKRHFGVDMVSWEDTVMPRYGELVRAMADGVIAAGTITTTHSLKTGKLYKKPKIEYAPAAKKLIKLKDPLKIAEALNFEKPTLRHVPYEEFVEYATLDPFITCRLDSIL